MIWSRFNFMFNSGNGETLLYNSGSNSLMRLDEKASEKVTEIKANPNQDYSGSPDLYFKLRFGGFLVDDGADDDLVRIQKMNRLASRYADGELMLTIALTHNCNFVCSYCYERNRTLTAMSDETMDGVIQFISKHKLANKIKVYWYGGEPLLEFGRLKILSRKIQSIGLEYDAHLVTNGYLLTSEIIKGLGELSLSHIQITIDGIKETHDKRRRLLCGGGTYDRIVGNVDKLMCSGWGGCLNLRVNVDKVNCGEFIEVHDFFRQKCADKFDKRVSVYPGFIDNHEIMDSDCFTASDKGLFLIGLAEKHGIDALKMYPKLETSGCTMTKKNAYVVGPEGELYKCWRSLGNKNEVVGNVFGTDNWNMPMIARGMVGGSYLDDDGCVRCLFFPICDGGCSKVRLMNSQSNGERDVCMHFKHHLERFMDVHCRWQKCFM